MKCFEKGKEESVVFRYMIEFIKAKHIKELDCYGFIMNILTI